MSSWHSYPSIHNLGHAAVADLLNHPVIVEEKIDGSQFSFGVFEQDGEHPLNEDPSEYVELRVRSKGSVMQLEAPEKMFTKAVESVKERLHLLRLGWTYRAEYLQKPKHNALAYDRVPTGHLIIFDINTDEERYLGPDEKRAEAERIGFECVPGLFYGHIASLDDFKALLETTSILGGQKIEGVVVKSSSYDQFGKDHKVLMGKFVSEAFKEVHKLAWKVGNPRNGDILEQLAARYTTPARWQKAVLHLQERGLLEHSPRDIGALFKEVPTDVEKEATDEIKEFLFAWAWPHVRRAVTRGLPDWYKQWLLERQFAPETSDGTVVAGNPEN